VRRLALLALLALACVGCGGEDPPEIVTEQVGSGARSAIVVREDVDEPQPVVVFLHGWGGTELRIYRPWIDHLARAGNAVIFPRYQDSFLSPPPEALPNALAGIRAALERVQEQDGSLVVAGHSAGGALAADYAAAAAGAGLPEAQAVLAVYPGRRLRGVPFFIPERELEEVDARVVALAGARDTVVGDDEARRIAREADGEFELVTNPAVADHGAPQRADPLARRTFWARLDALIAAARR